MGAHRPICRFSEPRKIARLLTHVIRSRAERTCSKNQLDMIEDWQKQVDRIEKSYETIFHSDFQELPVGNDRTDLHHGVSGMSAMDIVERDTDYHGPNRFPPRHNPSGLSSLDMEKYLGDAPDGLADSVNEIVLAALDNRDNVMTHYTYLTVNLPESLMEPDFRVLNATAVDLKESLQDAEKLVRKIEEMTSTRTDGANAFMSGGHSQPSEEEKELIGGLFTVKSAQMLKEDISDTVMLILSLINIAEDALYAPRGITCKLNGIVTDWTDAAIAQDLQLNAAPRTIEAHQYAQLMLSNKMAVNTKIYEFLGNMAVNNYSMVLRDQSFQGNELEILLQFLCTTNLRGQLSSRRLSSVITALYFDSCGLSDNDVELFTHFLPEFSSLSRLSLRRNNVTSAGCTTLAMVLWEQGLPLQVLMLDHNRIGTNGALMLSKALYRCRHVTRLSVNDNPIGDVGFYYLIRATMNSIRKARKSLPRPPELDDEEEGNSDFHSEGEDSDDEALVKLQQRNRRKTKKKKRSASVLRGYFDANNSDDSTDDEEDNYDKDRDEDDSSSGEEEDEEDDLFTATGENESVYSEVPPKISSKVAVALNKGPIGLVQASNFTNHHIGHENHAHNNKPASANLWQMVYKRVRIKVMALNAFLNVRRRGLPLRSLSVANCGLGPMSAAIAAHACADNHYLHSLDLSHNAIGHSELENADSKALMSLGADTGLTSLKVRQVGLLEDGMAALIRGANRSSTLNEIDLSGNHCGPTGAAIVASARNFFVDQASFSLGFKPMVSSLTGEDALMRASKHKDHQRHSKDKGKKEKPESLFHGDQVNQALRVNAQSLSASAKLGSQRKVTMK